MKVVGSNTTRSNVAADASDSTNPKASSATAQRSTAATPAKDELVALDSLFRLFGLPSLLQPPASQASTAATSNAGAGLRRGLSDAPAGEAAPPPPAPGLGVGAEGAKVKGAEARLKRAGFATGKVDGKLTTKTEQALREFQAASGLPVTGRLDDRTFKKLGAVDKRVRRHGGKVDGRGQQSDRIETAERRLKRLGYDVGKVDGTFDAKTAEAVRAFKQDQPRLKGSRSSLIGERAASVLKREVAAVAHDPFRSRVKPSAARRRDDDRVAKAAMRVRDDGTRGLGEGQRGRAVKVVQEHLKAAGFDPQRTDGVFDERTAGALRNFQRRSGIEEHGRVDPRTWNRLQRATLEAKDGTSPKQRIGERSGAVRHTEKLLKELGHNPGPVDGRYTPNTERAIDAFRRKHRMRPADGVGPGTLEALRRAVKKRRADGPISARGRQQMKDLLDVAQRNAAGKRPMGWCLREVGDYLDAVSYGKIGRGQAPRLPLARNFAEYLNEGRRYDDLGLKKLKITNPYKAPPGAIIVVRPGTPGTAHPTAGDIVIKGHGNRLFNDGEMSYGGPGNFPKGNNYVLGVYVPK